MLKTIIIVTNINVINSRNNGKNSDKSNALAKKILNLTKS